ncbi:MAG: hypothetical protein ACE5I1_16585, partial [bacterium]
KNNDVREKSTSLNTIEEPADIEDDLFVDKNLLPDDHSKKEDTIEKEVLNQGITDNIAIPDTIKNANAESVPVKQKNGISNEKNTDYEASDPHEPLGLNVGFFQEVNTAHNEIKSIIEHLQAGDVPRKDLKLLKAIFLDLRESSMVHGFSELEEISHKSQKYIERLLKESLIFSVSEIRLFQELPGMIKCSLSENLDDERANALRGFALRLTQDVTEPPKVAYEEAFPLSDSILQEISEKQLNKKLPADDEAQIDDEEMIEAGNLDLQEQVAENEENPGFAIAHENDLTEGEENRTADPPALQKVAAQKEDRPSQTEIELDPDLVTDREEELMSDILDETLSEHFVEDMPQKEGEDFSLYMPGEDDPELLDLINEVTNRKAETDGTQDDEEDGPFFEHKQNIDLQDDSAATMPSAKAAHVKDDRMANFRHEADLYFRVVDEAIEQLLLNKQSRIAFENLELAAYSLKGLARKLGLEPLAKLPELVEELVGKIILLRIFPENDTYLTLKKAFTLLKKTADINEVEKREYRELDRTLLGLIRSLDEIEPTKSDKEMSVHTNPEVRQNLNGMRMGNFQLRGRKSLPNRGN